MRQTVAPESRLPPLDLVDCRAMLCNLVESSPIGVALGAPDGRIVYANLAFTNMLGYEPGKCDGVAIENLVVSEAVATIREQLRPLVAGEIEGQCTEQRCARKDGGTFWGRISISAVRSEAGGSSHHLIVQIENIDRLKAAEAAVATSETRMNYALESAGQGVWDYNLNTREMFYSRMWRQMRGFGLDEVVDGAQEVWLARVHPEDRERIRAIVRRQDSGEIKYNAFEYRERHRDGRWIWILSRGKPVEWNPDGSPARVMGTDTDITALKEEEARRAEEAAETFRQNLARLEKAHRAAEQAQQLALSLARHDALTGLPNRRVFSEVLAKSIARTNRSGGHNAVLIVDLDRFKPVNDVFGHAAGDTVLCEIAKRLQDVVRSTDTVARLGGDEFAIVTDTLEAAKAPGEAASHLARRIIEAVQRPVTIGQRGVEVGASIGISVCPTDGRDPETLMRAADIAMYRAKQEGRGTFRFFQSSMEAELRARAELEEDVRAAVLHGDIQPHYQPLIQLAENRLTGFEILARWRHPKRGDVPPDVFIPVVEQIGLIGDLTYALLRRACEDARKWPPDITISLNISPVHLTDSLLPVRVLAILSETGFPPKRLEIEITETALARDLDSARAALATLKDLGIRIALDDFGTGYSNLYHLRELQFDKIKIDRSFVQSMGTDDGNARLVHSILELARNLGMPTIAEGIEKVETVRQIMASGGEFGQGFYFGKAMPAPEADRMVEAAEAAASTRQAAS